LIELAGAGAIAFVREDLRETGERVFAFGEREGFFGRGDGCVVLAGGGERGGVDADRVGLARECVAVERADAFGFGRIVERPWVVAGAVAARPVLTATLAGDHRATDGHRGALFLAAVDRLLQEPEKL